MKDRIQRLRWWFWRLLHRKSPWWTQAEVDDIMRRAHEEYESMKELWE